MYATPFVGALLESGLWNAIHLEGCAWHAQEVGEIDVAILSIVRRCHLCGQIPLREIAKLCASPATLYGAICAPASRFPPSHLARPEHAP